MTRYKGNLITTTDSYKVSHYKQYPPGTKHVFSFFESRGGEFDSVTFFGLQYLLKEYLEGAVITESDIIRARKYFERHFGNTDMFNEAGWRHILEEHGGRLPIRILAIPEGTVVPNSNVLMTIENTDPDVPWLTNYLETLLAQLWYPSTVASQSRFLRHTILEYLEKTGDPSLIDFKLHDFGYRGSTSVESAGIGAAAHLLSFMGTDTLAGIDVAHDYYGEDMAGFSIPAAEHSTITSWGKDNELAAFRNMLTAYPTGPVAVVSDSYDIFHACKTLWGKELRDEVLGRDGFVVVRPDSGDPNEVVAKVLDILGEAFGYTENEKGFKVLDPHIRIIQGDGIDRHSLRSILYTMRLRGWSADNIAFGSGGGLLQKLDRDTLKFAFKCSAVQVDGEWRNVIKTPVTDPGKRSKAGRLKLIKNGDSYQTVPYESEGENLLVEVFCDGKITREYSFEEIRGRVQS